MDILGLREKLGSGSPDQFLEDVESEMDWIDDEYRKNNEGYHNSHVIENDYQSSQDILDSTDTSGYISGLSAILDYDYLKAQAKVVRHEQLRDQLESFK